MIVLGDKVELAPLQIALTTDEAVHRDFLLECNENQPDNAVPAYQKAVGELCTDLWSSPRSYTSFRGKT